MSRIPVLSGLVAVLVWVLSGTLARAERFQIHRDESSVVIVGPERDVHEANMRSHCSLVAGANT